MITQYRLRQLFEYDPQSGQLIWRESRGGRAMKGDIAGYNDRGRFVIKIDGSRYSLHRLVWMYHYGEAETLLTHKDGNYKNNRIENITPMVRKTNKPKIYPRHTGVCKTNNKWWASIRDASRFKVIGCYETQQEAYDAYKSKSIELHGEESPFFGLGS